MNALKMAVASGFLQVMGVLHPATARAGAEVDRQCRSVSAVIDLAPRVISPIRVAGTPIAVARAFLVKPNGPIKPSSRISPG